MNTKTKRKFDVTGEYLGYENAREVSSYDPRFFIAGSKNVIIDTGKRSYTSRNGMRILGAVASGELGIKGYTRWSTAKQHYHLLRSYGQKLEVYYNETWIQLLDDLSSPKLFFAEVFDETEQSDLLCFVNGESKILNWSGGATTACAQAIGGTTLKMQGSYTASTIAFVEGGASNDTITDSASRFVTAGFASGDTISVSGTTNNNRSFQIATVTAGTITLIPDDDVTAEAVGSSILIHNGFATWAATGFLQSGTRKILIAGTAYEYTGAEDTDTLTGVDTLPAITAGTVIVQETRSNDNASPIPTGYTNDFIGSQRNQIYVGSKTSRLIFGSKTSSYTDFSYTANRLPGEGVELNMDTTCAGFEPTENDLTIFGEQDDIYSIMFQKSADNTKEAVDIDKKQTSPNQGLISPHAKTRIKNAIAYITKEPTLDTLGNIENMASPQNVPVSDLIKIDFDAYDFTGACILYWKRNIVVSVPAEAKVLLYDLRYALWQPPQEFAASIGGLSIAENGNLIGHSYATDESYTMFTELSDEVGELVDGDNDGFVIEARARHFSSDEIIGERKLFNHYYLDAYVSAGIEMEHHLYYEIDGSRKKANKTIDALSDQFLFGESDISTLGMNPLGSKPIGGGGITSTAGLFRYRRIFTYPKFPYYEYISEFYNISATEQFKIVHHGPEADLVESSDISITD